MSSLVLLNRDGNIARKLQFVSLPDDYVVPEGMTISWRTNVQSSSRDPLVNLRSARIEPVEAFFYLGSAWGQVCRGEVRQWERDRFGQMRYRSRTLTITVQGPSVEDVRKLRDLIMNIINSGVCWKASNDLNPKPKVGLLRRLFGMSK